MRSFTTLVIHKSSSAAKVRRLDVAMPEQRVIPALRIANYERSKSYYVTTLGFVVEWEHRFEPHFPVFCRLCARVCDST
jgi:hypothetical protein